MDEVLPRTWSSNSPNAYNSQETDPLSASAEPIYPFRRGFARRRAAESPRADGGHGQAAPGAARQQQSPEQSQRQRRGCQHNCRQTLPTSQKLLVGKYRLPLASGSRDYCPKTHRLVREWQDKQRSISPVSPPLLPRIFDTSPSPIPPPPCVRFFKNL